MSARRTLCSAFWLLAFAFCLTGCESTAPADGASSTEPAAEPEASDVPSELKRDGGNVRTTRFHPPMSSEISRADRRFW